MRNFDRKLLTDHGYTLECESPFELRSEHDPETRGTGWIAMAVLDVLRREYIDRMVREFEKALKLEMDR